MNRQRILIISSLCLLLGSNTSLAGERTEREMLSIAQLQLAKGAKTRSVLTIEKLAEERFYNVYGDENRFVIVSRENSFTPVLAYSDSHFDAASLPCGMQWWLGAISEQMEAKSQVAISATRTVSFEPVPYLCKTKWNQGDPYNFFTPELNGSHTPTGCVATAMSQIMKYFSYPTQGKGKGYYTLNGSSSRVNEDISGVYKWDQMLDTYNESSLTDKIREPVARLMKDAGLATNMDYGTNGSGAFSVTASRGFCYNFSYDSLAMHCYYRDFFSEDMMRVYFGQFPERMKIDWHTFMGLGRYNINDSGEKFSMSVLAANMSQGINGVSWLHGKVSQEILAGMWPGYLPEEVNVGYVTNGVHYDTWTAPEWKAIHAKVFGKDFATHHYDKSCFDEIYKVADKDIWNVRSILRKRLIDYVKRTISDTKSTAHYSPSQIVKIKSTLRNDVLTIGFARRFATYKRATLLFRDLDRLAKIVNNPDRPVQFLFAGKAHPADKAGSALIKQIVEISKMPQFIGKIVFVPNYDISVAKMLVQGVDIWMNNPTRRQEASGTSGEKAVMNGVMHFSVLDGWWVEGYKDGAGWALPLERTYEKQEFQDDLDAAMLYNIIANEIAPAFYNKDWDKDYSPEWIKYIKNTIAMVASNFTTNRMMEDYLERYYRPQAKRYNMMVDKDFLKAREIAQWKKRMYRAWPDIQIRSFKGGDGSARLSLGENNYSEVEVFLPGLTPDEIGLECVITEQDAKGNYHISELHQYEVVSFDDCVATYRANITPTKVGTYQIATRMFAKSPDMAHRQDFELVRWL